MSGVNFQMQTFEKPLKRGNQPNRELMKKNMTCKCRIRVKKTGKVTIRMYNGSVVVIKQTG